MNSQDLLNIDLGNLYIRNATVKSIEESAEKQREELVALSSMLQQLMGSMAGARSGDDETSSVSSAAATAKDHEFLHGISSNPSTNPTLGSNSTDSSGGPSPAAMAQALAALQAALQNVQYEIATATSQSEKDGLIVEQSQITQAIALVKEMKLQTFLHNLTNVIANIMNEYGGWDSTSWNWGDFGYAINQGQNTAIINAINAYLKQNGFSPVTITPQYSWQAGSFTQQDSINAMELISDVISDVQAQSGTPAVSLSTIEKELSRLNNPTVQNIIKLMKRGNTLTTAELSMIREMSNELAKILSHGKSVGSAGPSNGQLVEAMGAMTTFLNNLQDIIAQFGQSKAQNDTTIGQDYVNQSENNMQLASYQSQKIAAEEAEQNSLGTAMKWIEGVAGAIMAAVAIATGNIGLAAIIITMTVMQETGAMTDITSSISQDLQKDGMSQTDANYLASAIVVVVVLVATLGTSAAVSAFTSTAEVATDASETAATTAAQDTEQSIGSRVMNYLNNIWSKMGENLSNLKNSTSLKEVATNLSKCNPFTALPRIVNIAIANTLQAMSASGFYNNAAAYDTRNESQQQQEQAEMVANITGGVLGTVFSGMALSASISSATAEGESLMTNLNRQGLKFGQLLSRLNPNLISALYYAANIGGGALNATCQAGKAAIYAQQASATKLMGQYNAATKLFQSYETQTTTGMENSQKTLDSIIQGHGQLDAKVQQQIWAGQAAVAQILSQSA